MVGCLSLGKNQGIENLSPGAPVGRINDCCRWRIADDVTRLCEGAPSVGENPVGDPSAIIILLLRSVHDDGLRWLPPDTMPQPKSTDRLKW